LQSRRSGRPDGSRRSGRRALARLAATIGAVGVLAAGVASCGEPEKGQAGPDNSTSSAADVANVVKPITGPPRKGGTLIVGLDAESEGFNPADSRFAAGTYTVGRTIFDPLVAIDAEGKARPYLAESITSSNDARTWTIKMRPNITFHDGAPLDAAAVKNFIDTFKRSARVGTSARPVESVDVVDNLTVRVNMNQPWATYPNYLYLQGGYIAAPSMLASADGSRKPVGTGPFKFKSWTTDKSLIVEKNPDHWR
jgi:peptide/nickel transport system substrate-binding protein